MGNYAFEARRAPQLKGLALAFGALCGSIVVFGLLKTSDQFVRALFGTATGVLGKVPWIGGTLTAPIHRIQQRLTNILGSWAEDWRARIGQYFRDLGQVIEGLASALVDDAAILFGLVALMVKYDLDYAVLKAAARLTRKAVHAVTATVAHATHRQSVQTKTQTATTKTIARRTTVIVKTDVQWRGYTKRQLRALRASIAAVTALVAGHVIGGTRERVGGLVGGLTGIRHRLGRVEKLLGVGALTGTLAFALGRLGVGWTRCSNWKRVGKTVCGMDSRVLEDLLAGSLLIVGSVSIVQLAEELQGVMDDAVTGFEAFVREL